MFKESTLNHIANDPDTAKHVVRSLEKEVVRLQSKVAKLAGYEGETGLLEEVEATLLQSQLENKILKQKLFGKKSEKLTKEGENSQSDDTKTITKEKRKKPEGSGRGQVGEGLPKVKEIYELPEGSRCDCAMQGPLKKMKRLITTRLVDYIPAKLVCRKIERQTYRAKQCGCKVVAPGPTTLVDGGQYGIDLATEVVARKFADSTPWERQSKAFKRDGLDLATTTLWNLTRHSGELLELVWEKIREDIEADSVRHADETRWKVLKGVKNQQQYAWLFQNSRHAYFTIEDSRSGKVPLKVMPAAEGALVTDDYDGYNELVEENKLLRVLCWAHTRRKFFDIRELEPTVTIFLDLVADLYKQDKLFREGGPQTAERRRDLCGPLIQAIDDWRKNQICLPKSPFRKALNYMDDNWDELTVFLDNPSLQLDNNCAERALRQLVLGRKNFLFNKSMEGARISAILYSICVSCAMNGVDPKAYMKQTILRIRNGRGFQLPYDFANQPEILELV